ncbi:hypothetical protein LIP_1977 [Limnochorda pilosa]|uniref:Uncharacterized protein n=1 Tax=Limnochorda pilosa TaxID=1555112 RepID=A0A0K2SL27_LIMPI|nr:hypothetical protein LIP_1977 [Limnochorda pilosa]
MRSLGYTAARFGARDSTREIGPGRRLAGIRTRPVSEIETTFTVIVAQRLNLDAFCDRVLP